MPLQTRTRGDGARSWRRTSAAGEAKTGGGTAALHGGGLDVAECGTGPALDAENFDGFGLGGRRRKHLARGLKHVRDVPEPGGATEVCPIGVRPEVIRVGRGAEQRHPGAEGCRQFSPVGQRVLGEAGAVQEDEDVVDALGHHGAVGLVAAHDERGVADGPHHPGGHAAREHTGDLAPPVG